MFKNLSNKTKLMTIAGFIVALMAIPLTIIQVQKQQSIRQHAAVGDSVSFNISPQTARKNAKGESFGADVRLLNGSEKDISSIDITIQYDSSILGANFQPDGTLGYTTVLNETKNNTIHYVAVNPSLNPITGADLSLGTLTLTGKTEGNGKVSLENAQVTAAGNSEKLAVDTSMGTSERQYAIGNIDSSLTPTPTPTLILTFTPTPTTILSAAQLNSQCLKLCDQGALVSGTFDKPACTQNCDNKYKQQEFTTVTFTPTSSTSSASRQSMDTASCKQSCGNYCAENVDKFPDQSTCINNCVNTNCLPTPTPTSSLSPATSFSTSLVATITPVPFTPSTFPINGPVGTSFVISAQSKPSQQFKAIIYFFPPNSNQATEVARLTLYDDGNHGDGAVNDGVYSNIFDSTGKPSGNYGVNTLSSDNVEISTGFTVEDLSISSNTCVPIVNNGNISNKINIVVVSNGFKQEELGGFQNTILPAHINYFFSKDPFSLNRNKFNVWFLKIVNNENCSYQNAGACTNNVKTIVSRSCGFFDAIIILNNGSLGSKAYGYATNGVAVARSGPDNAPGLPLENNMDRAIITTVHEFGHSFGNLADEYEVHDNSSDTTRVNCDTFGCPKWCSGISSLEKPECASIQSPEVCTAKIYNKVNCQWSTEINRCYYPSYSYIPNDNLNYGQGCYADTGCYYGCGGENGYRSSINSTMNIPNTSVDYNAVSKKAIQGKIDSLCSYKRC